MAVAATVIPASPPDGATVTFLSVGQGDAIVVRDGPHTMLVDGGRDPAVLQAALRRHGVGAVDLQLANNFLLPSVAAAVIGGTSIFGGVGTYTGTILGALILGVLQSMLTFLGAGQAIQQMLYGSIVIGLSWLYTRIAAAQ